MEGERGKRTKDGREKASEKRKVAKRGWGIFLLALPSSVREEERGGEL